MEIPDIYIRWHYSNSISRSIPLTSDPKVLAKRIEIYFDILSFVRDNKIILTKSQSKTVWSMIYYLCTCFLTEHNSTRKFTQYWLKTRKLMKVNLYHHYLSYIFQLLVYWKKYSIYFIKVRMIYYSIFKKYLADSSIIDNTSLFRTKIKENINTV